MAWSWHLDSATAAESRCTSPSTSSGGSRSRNTAVASRSTSSACPTAIPGETPMPLKCTVTARSCVFSEPPAHEIGQRVDRQHFVVAFGAHHDGGAGGRGQQQDTQDRLPVH